MRQKRHLVVSHKYFCRLATVLHFSFISIFIILLTRRKAMQAICIEQAITSTCFRRCQKIAERLKFLFGFLVCQDRQAGESALKVCFPSTQQNGASRF